MNYLSKNIRYIRTLKRLSQEQFADDLNVSRSRISSYEENRANPPISFLIALSDYSNFTMEALIKKKLNTLK
ncbi:helix-turn-helix transcriptional regulator [uncultured Lutibacter sp.]|uniref:helix-turn-helix domain-containing protein n=1 Tax=uncultured Lutibacter sp. TaxID=437739 RepID=UPI00261A8BC8|nr:helix-turn-helix transcriptional regulator [uncultured Lutibacter sp.]